MGFEFGLSKRELEIAGLIAKGHSSERIAKLLFLSEGTVRNYTTSIFEKAGVRNRAQLVAKYMEEYAQADTEVPDPPRGPDTPARRDCAKLRLVGLPSLPHVIPLADGCQEFVIGRFDVTVGRKQCDFEFGKATKAVSRRHASIERTASGYAIVDLGSRVGTFVNGDRIAPGDPCPIRQGDRVSFGNAGADYVFEC